jgi:hypothetical protein
MPNQTWQSDFTHYRLATGTEVEIISWLDDCTRYALHISAHPGLCGTRRGTKDPYRQRPGPKSGGAPERAAYHWRPSATPAKSVHSPDTRHLVTTPV